ncbi:serine/threonine-protein kinase/endoribonuclease IRE1, partial [Phenoliferia sp. Uapishka_3]
MNKHGHGGVRMLISDFGLCKKLDRDESSFQQTVNHAAGSFGYRAPEVLRGQVDMDSMTVGGGAGSSGTTGDSRMASSVGSGGGGGMNTDPSMRLTRSIDIFSLGCIFYYVLTGGEHPFGGRYEREMNILKGKVELGSLDGLGEEALEVQDLITRMVASDPRERPPAESVLLHPFFWNAQKRLLFICDASDRFEIMERDPPTPTLVTLETTSATVVGDDWQKALDRTLLDNLGKYRKYDGRMNLVKETSQVGRRVSSGTGGYLPCPFDPTSYITHYLQWRSGAPRLKNILSTLVINSYGLHCSLSPSVSLYGAVMPLLAFAQTAYPRPLSLWMTLHAPGGNKPEQWLPSQGSGKVKGYNTQMETAIKALRPGETMIEGAVGYLDWYGLTDGASSFDGTHYMWQINMEKAMLVLNLMDALWTEAVEDGGLWDVES